MKRTRQNLADEIKQAAKDDAANAIEYFKLIQNKCKTTNGHANQLAIVESMFTALGKKKSYVFRSILNKKKVLLHNNRNNMSILTPHVFATTSELELSTSLEILRTTVKETARHIEKCITSRDKPQLLIAPIFNYEHMAVLFLKKDEQNDKYKLHAYNPNHDEVMSEITQIVKNIPGDANIEYIASRSNNKELCFAMSWDVITYAFEGKFKDVYKRKDTYHYNCKEMLFVQPQSKMTIPKDNCLTTDEEKQLKNANTAVEKAKRTLKEAERELQEPERKLQEAKQKLQEAKQKVQEAKKKVQEAKKTVQPFKKMIANSKKTITTWQKEIDQLESIRRVRKDAIKQDIKYNEEIEKAKRSSGAGTSKPVTAKEPQRE